MSVDVDDGGRMARAEKIWRTSFYWALAIVAAQFALAIYFAQKIWPLARVPMHYDLQGHVNRWAGGHEGAYFMFLLPSISLIVTASLRFASKNGPHLEGMAATPRLFAATLIGVPLVLFGALVAVATNMIAPPPDGETGWSVRVILGLAGLLVAVLGNFLGKTQRNWWIGVRTPWSLSSDAAWAKSNRLAGRLMVLTGLSSALVAMFGPAYAAGLVLGLGSAVMAVCAVYVSWDVWRHDPNRTA